jgi:hypothetical protein
MDVHAGSSSELAAHKFLVKEVKSSLSVLDKQDLLVVEFLPRLVELDNVRSVMDRYRNQDRNHLQLVDRLRSSIYRFFQ